MNVAENLLLANNPISKHIASVLWLDVLPAWPKMQQNPESKK